MAVDRYSIVGATAELVESLGGRVAKETRSGIVFASLSREQVEKLKEQGCRVKPVSGVCPAILPPVTPPVPIAGMPVYTPEQLVVGVGFDRIRDLAVPPLYGEGFNLAIVDTGIRETHEKINGRVVYSKNFTASPPGDGFDHGTGVASIALAVAPHCNLLDFKVLGDDGYGTDEDVVMALDDLLVMHDDGSEYAPHVVNLSLGEPDDGDPYNPLRMASRALVERGIWVIAAAGNAGPGPGTVMTPACERYVVAVGSVSYEPFQISQFSGRGPTQEGLVKPDIVLFGENIAMASSHSDTSVTAKSGTSFAAPFASGMVILYHNAILVHGAQYSPEEAPEAVYHQLLQLVSPEQMIDRYLGALSIKPEGAPRTKDESYGWGVPYGPLVTQAFARKTAMADVMGMVVPIIGIGFMGMMMSGMVKAMR